MRDYIERIDELGVKFAMASLVILMAYVVATA